MNQRIPVNGPDLIIERVESHYFPFWQESQMFPSFLEKLLRPYLSQPHRTVATTTAELADCFSTKREGVKFVLSVLSKLDYSAKVLLSSGEIVVIEEGLANPLLIAAANWVAPVSLLSQYLPDAIFIDSGSTTTDITPISGGRHTISDPTDRGRLTNSQLVYSGTQRTNVATIVDHVVIDGQSVDIASENFATMADVNLILGLITQKDFTGPPSDGGEISREGAMRRLSRIICSDLESVSEREILEMARYIRDAQVSKISKNLVNLLDQNCFDARVPCIVAGSGRSTLAEPAARDAGLTNIQAFHEYLQKTIRVHCKCRVEKVSSCAPAVSLSLLPSEEDIPCG